VNQFTEYYHFRRMKNSRAIVRTIIPELKELFFDGKAIVIIGPRQTSKTTMLKQLAASFGQYLYLYGDDAATCQQLTNTSYEGLKPIIGTHRIIFIDAVQRIRNAIINNFNPIPFRQDKGILSENFLMNERKKYLNSNKIYSRSYFWRSVQQQKIDLIEEVGGEVHDYAFKWNPSSAIKVPSAFARTYESSFEVIPPKHFTAFVTLKEKSA